MRPDADGPTSALPNSQPRWEAALATRPDMFGHEPSHAAHVAAEQFRNEGRKTILELGAGQGRDTLFLARSGFTVTALDYSGSGSEIIRREAQALGIDGALTTLQHDVRERLPFPTDTFDGCYSHMLYCMALTRAQLEVLAAEILRVLRPNGLNVFTVRNISDPHYRQGAHHGENLYELDGFIVHFFTREMVDHLARGYLMVSSEEFEEGGLPRRLSLVTLRKPGESPE